SVWTAGVTCCMGYLFVTGLAGYGSFTAGGTALDERAEELNVGAHLLAREICVAVSQRGEDRPVHLGDHPEIGVRFDDADQRARLDAQGAPDLEQDEVAGALD